MLCRQKNVVFRKIICILQQLILKRCHECESEQGYFYENIWKGVNGREKGCNYIISQIKEKLKLHKLFLHVSNR